MDNGSKLKPSQIKNLINDLKNEAQGGRPDIEALSKKHLNEQQAQALKRLLNDPQMIKTVLASEKAQQIMKKLREENEDE